MCSNRHARLLHESCVPPSRSTREKGGSKRHEHKEQPPTLVSEDPCQHSLSVQGRSDNSCKPTGP